MKAQIVEFKSISPFFEQCRDGAKPVELRRVDKEDKRFHWMVFWNIFKSEKDLRLVKLCHVGSGQVCYFEFRGLEMLRCEPEWAIIRLGRVVPKEEAEA